MHRLRVFIPTVLETTAFFVCAAVVMYLLTDAPYISYPKQPFTVHGPITAGNGIGVEVYRCNSDSKVHRIASSRRLVGVDNATVYFLPAGDALAEPGCNMAIGDAAVPAAACSGMYRVEIVAETPGRSHQFELQTRTQDFQVIGLPEVDASPHCASRSEGGE